LGPLARLRAILQRARARARAAAPAGLGLGSANCRARQRAAHHGRVEAATATAGIAISSNRSSRCRAGERRAETARQIAPACEARIAAAGPAARFHSPARTWVARRASSCRSQADAQPAGPRALARRRRHGRRRVRRPTSYYPLRAAPSRDLAGLVVAALVLWMLDVLLRGAGVQPAT
jgi:hypothetical protein